MTAEQTNSGIRILVDADACPVKNEIFKVAERYDLPVLLVANSYMRIPRDENIELTVVSDNFDAADDHIAKLADENKIVITADILLADRCLKAGSTVIGTNGNPFSDASIGGAIATRAIMADLRAGGEQIGGPKPFSAKDRSRFLSALDLAIVQMKKSMGKK